MRIARSASFQRSPPSVSYAYQKPRCSQTTGSLHVKSQHSDQAGLIGEPVLILVVTFVQLIRRKMVMTAKESMRKRASSSQVYENMQEVFIEMDKSPLVRSQTQYH